MLNIGRMAPGSHDYYLQVVAQGVEDYYLARGEAPGQWLGEGADGLGLSGRVDGPQLAAVLAGDDPMSGRRLAAHPARRVPGFDLTFRPPKSVSLLWALADRPTGAQVQAAHDAAVAAAVRYLEREAAWTRRGAGGTERVKAEGFVAAGFRHRTSRAGDPLLHTHVLVANLARTVDDGVWRTLDSRRIYAHAKTAGLLYQAQLRHELTRRLGVGFAPLVHGHADLAGVPRAWIDAFSRRRTQIVARMAERGETSAKAAQVATLETRAAKGQQASEAELRAGWADRARRLGIPTGWYRDLLDRQQPQPPDVTALYEDLVVREGLTEHASTFDRRDVVQQVAGRLPAGAPIEHVERIARALIDHDPDRVLALGPTRGRLRTVDTIRRGDGSVVATDADEPRFTTRGLLQTEQRAIDGCLARAHDGIAVVDRRRLPAGLSDEQAAMVVRLTGSGAGVEVVVGKAGTGKTFALDAARQAWTDAGIDVRGVALAARAALELQAATGIPSTTLARLLARAHDHRDGSPLRPGSVLVVDEAGMVGTRQLAHLLDHAAAQRVKVVLIGDPRQLPEIDAGGLFAALATRLPAVELTVNRRQRQPWERHALDALRHGDVRDGIDRLDRHGRIVTATDAEAVRERLVTDWWSAYDHHGATSAIMIALRRTDVDDLNQRARTRLQAAGLLTGTPLEIAGATFQTGDRIVCLRNDRRLGVVNGTHATVIHANATARYLRVRTDDGHDRQLPADYLDAGHVTHGYAITGHKAQGATVDHTFVLGSPELYREWGYVALSRGRDTNRLYTHPGPRPDPDLDRHHREPATDPIASLTARLDRTRAQPPVTDDTAALADRWRQRRRQLADPAITRQRQLSEQHDRVTRQRAGTLAALERDTTRLAGLGPLRHRRQRADLHDRIDSHRARLADLDQQLHATETELAGLPTATTIAAARADLRDTTIALRDRAATRADRALDNPPHHLLATLGTPPDHPHGRQTWRDTAHAIEEYRLRWNITDPHRPLGTQPTDPLQTHDHQRTLDQLTHTQQTLTRQHEPTHRHHGLSR